MTKKIHLGYEIGTGNPVEIPLSHLIATGVTQLSGKTTTLEALIKRSGLRAIIFKTKIGEKEFGEGTEIAPFFKDRSDYEFVKSLIEAYAKEKLHLEKGTLMALCKGSKDLNEIKKKVDEQLASGKTRGIKEEIYLRLQHYLENLIPQIQNARLSKELRLAQGMKYIVNIEKFSPEAQSLIIEATVTEILTRFSDTIVVIPEAWKFLPQKYSNPCKRAVERYIREGATNNNYLWIDSQDMAGVDKTPLKQVSTWILGFQSERNEVKHTLDQIPLPKQQKPSEDDVMTLRKGQFYVSSYDSVNKVYVQPVWVDKESAIKIAKGEMCVEDVEKPLIKSDIEKPEKVNPNTETASYHELKLELDFKIEQFQKRLSDFSNQLKFTEELVVKQGEIIEAIQKSGTGVSVYQVAPLEKIRQDFLLETKDKIIGEIKKLRPEHCKIIKFVESAGKGMNQTEIVSRCFFLAPTGGGSRQKVLNWCREIESLQLLRKDKNNVMYPHLREIIADMLQFHGAPEKDVEQLYNYILVELIGSIEEKK